MRIALLTDSVLEDDSVFSVFSGLSAAFSRQGSRVFLLSHRPNGPSRVLHKNNIETGRVIRIGSLSRFEDRYYPIRRRISRIIAENRVEFLQLHTCGWFRPWIRGALCAVPPKRRMISFQDFAHPDHSPNAARAAAELRSCILESGRATAVSRFIAERVIRSLRLPAGSIHVVPNGISSDYFPSGREKRPPYLLAVGRLRPYKGTDMLILAFSALKERNLSLIVCGQCDPGEKKRLLALAELVGVGGRVEIKGAISREEVRGLMAGCLCYVSYSRFESFGMANLEAMACGKAVVLARVGAVPEYSSLNRNAVLVEEKNPTALAAALQRIVGSPSLRRALGENAHKTARRYAWDRIAALYVDAFRSSGTA